MLDGFDLGVGISLTADSEERRGVLMTSLSNTWDERNLVSDGWRIVRCISLAYGTILTAYTFPIIMIFGFIFVPLRSSFVEQSERKFF